MEFSEQVLILHVGRFKESDIWLKLLSPTQGIFTAFAFGGSRSRQRFIGCLDIFNTVLFHIKLSSRSGYYCVEEGVLMQGVSLLRRDWGRLGIAKNCCSFIQSFGVEAEGANTAYALATETLHFLDTADAVHTLFPLFFRLRFASEQGYHINVSGCHYCGTQHFPRGAQLFVKEGLLVCPSCSQRGSGVSVHLSRESIEAFNIVQHNPPILWKRYDDDLQCYTDFSASVQRECGQAIDKFIEYHVGLHWDNGRFKKV